MCANRKWKLHPIFKAPKYKNLVNVKKEKIYICRFRNSLFNHKINNFCFIEKRVAFFIEGIRLKYESQKCGKR